MGNIEDDITVNLKNNDYVLTNAVINPVTKNNISTYMVKNNVPISFNLANADISRETVHLLNFYYKPYKNKNLLIRCYESIYSGGKDINVLPNQVYEYLSSKKKLSNNIIIFRLNYNVKPIQFGPTKSEESINKSVEFAFKIVSDEEFEMYKKMEEEKTLVEDDKVIRRPKKPKNQ